MNNAVLDFGDPKELLYRSRMLPIGFVKEERVQKEVVSFFETFNESIRGFHVEEIQGVNEKEELKKSYKIDALHKMVDSSESASLPLHEESSGTLKMFALYPDLKDVLENGGVLFVDELNARLHPLLVRNIILTFLSPEKNKNHAQLIFTTHDVWQFTNELLRRDEIWMVNKNKDGVSDLYSIAGLY